MAGAIYSWPSIVTLDSKDYVIEPPVQVQPVEDWAIGIRQGSPKYEHREHIQFRSFEDHSGGLGLKWGAAEEYPDRFYESQNVRTWDSKGSLTLAPLANAGGISGMDATGGGDFAIYPLGAGDDVYLFFGRGDQIYKKLGAGTSWVVETTGGGFTTVPDLTTFRNDEGGSHYNTLMAAHANTEPYQRYRNGVWDKPTSGDGNSPNGWSYEYADDFLPFENMILKMFFGEIQASLDGATWLDIVAVPGNTSFMAFFAGVGLNGVGDIVPYAVAEGKLFAVDVWTHQKAEVDVGMSQSITHAITWQDGEVVCTDGYTVKAYHPDRPVRDMGFDALEHGLGPNNHGSIKSLMAVQGRYLVAAVQIGSDYIQLFLWKGGAWHNLTGNLTGIWTGTGCALGYYNGASLVNPLQELWVVTTTNSYYLKCDGFRNPLINLAHNYAASGWIITTDFDGGFAEVPGIALEVECFAELTATETLQVEYALNGGSSYTSLGTFNNTTTRIKWASGAGIEFKSIRFRFTLARTAGDATKTPVIHAVVFKYLKVPKLRRRISFTVNAEQTGRQRGATPESILDELYALVAATTLKTLTWPGEGTYYVKVVTMPRFDYAESRTTVSKISDIRVECLQPVED